MKNSIYIIIGAVIVVLIVIIGSITPLISILNPETGVPRNTSNLIIGNETISIPGLQHDVTIIQDNYGVYHIYAQDNHDLFLALGFIQAKNRLFEMQLFKLTAMGQLAKMLGAGYSNYDRFQTMTGAPLTAEKDWNIISGNASVNATDRLTYEAVTAYSEGINDYINYSISHHVLPFEFKLLGYTPGYWSPVDTFAVQEYMIQTLEFSDDPLLYSLLFYKLGNLTNDLITPFSPIPQYYYGGYNGIPNQYVMKMSENTYPVNATVASLAFSVAKIWDPLHIFPPNPTDHSNEWVVSGNRTSTGKPILVGGPVLGFSLPSIWFQVQLVDPSFDVYGVVLPGAPIIVIGYNEHIGWTLTDTQAISWGTFFFTQTIMNGKYLWNGTYYPVTSYEINGFTVNWTNLGPIMATNGTTALVMDWMGNRFSNDIGALLEVMNATDWKQFSSDLEIWKAPYQNFAFADVNGTIADISPAYYPIFSSNNPIPYNPNAIMPGNGIQFIIGSIPYSMVPHSVNPADGFIVSSNQRQVGPAYPYWFGDTMTPSPGFRAMLEESYLRSHSNLTVEDMMNLQDHNYTDYEAFLTVPYILKYMSTYSNSTVQAGISMLKTWNYSMDANSRAASVWFFTYMYLFNEIFHTFLKDHGVFPEYRSVLNVTGMGGSFPNSIGISSFDLDLAYILINGSARPFSNESITSLIANAITEAMNYLSSQYPSGNYTWGHFYGFVFPSLLGVSQLSIGPLPRGGDYNTPNDASGVGPYNWPSGGQSFTMILNFSNLSDSYGVYPGGQSENPASPFYSNYVDYWINGEYLPLLFYPSSSSFPKAHVLDVTTLEVIG